MVHFFSTSYFLAILLLATTAFWGINNNSTFRSLHRLINLVKTSPFTSVNVSGSNILKAMIALSGSHTEIQHKTPVNILSTKDNRQVKKLRCAGGMKVLRPNPGMQCVVM